MKWFRILRDLVFDWEPICKGCPDGDQIVQPLGIRLLCQDNKVYARVNKKTNFAKIDSRRLQDGWECSGNDYYASKTHDKAGFTSFSAYRIIFEESKIYLARDDFNFS